jgi:O-glycosyl hydrolase
MNYTASSVKKEIESKKTLTINGDLRCPQNASWIQDDGTQCLQVPASCSHTQTRTCKQRIHIHEQGTKLVILTFYFTISQANFDGCIDAHDQQLGRLINRGKSSKNYSIDVMQFDAV